MQPTKKITQLPTTTAPTTSDKAVVVSGGITDQVALSDLIILFSANVPAGANSQITRGSETMFDFIANGTGVWTADNAGVNKNASMTALTIYINGRRITVSAVTARVFAASVDTYVDVLDNLDGTGTLVYTTAVNNAAAPALAANSVRLAIIVTGATTIAAAASINQGQEDRVLPIVASNPYAVTDSIGNLICPRDPQRKTLGYRQIVASFAPGTAAETLITGLTVPFISPSAQKTLATFFSGNVGATTTPVPRIYNGTFGSGGTQIQQTNVNVNGPVTMPVERTPSSTSNTYSMSIAAVAGNTVTQAGTTNPSYLRIERA